MENLDLALHRGRSSTGRSGGSRSGGAAQPPKQRLLLLLNAQTWLGEEGEALAELIRWSRSAGDDEIVMVHCDRTLTLALTSALALALTLT